jgi:6-phosphogluconolactonase
MKITGRYFLFAFLGLALISPLLLRATKNHAQYTAFIGTYTSTGDWRGATTSKGIYMSHYDSVRGILSAPELAVEATDPSFLVLHPSGKFLYAVNELETFPGEKSGAVSAFSIDPKTHKLLLLNKVSSGGAGPCHIALDRTGKFVFVANYDAGSTSVYPIGNDGRLEPPSSFIQHSGSGPAKNQEGPHAHWMGTSLDNRFVLVADLGLDKILNYKFDATNGTLVPNDPPFTKIAPGSGPRHLAFATNGKFVYLVSELSAEVSAFRFDPATGALTPLQTQTTLPADYSGPKADAEIAVHPNGKFLYVSNRGHDSITLFTIDPITGLLTNKGQTSTQGKIPRAFVIDPSGQHLLVANQLSQSVLTYKIDPITGVLTPQPPLTTVQGPSSIVFLPQLE